MSFARLNELSNEFLQKLQKGQGSTREDNTTLLYTTLLDRVTSIIRSNPMISASELRDSLFKESGISEAATKLIKQKRLSAGMVFAYGTSNYQEIIICGNQQEVICTKDGCFIDKPIPMTIDSIFDLSSVTKLLTCFTVMRLFEKKVLDIKSPIKRYDKRFQNIAHLSIEELMSFSPLLKTDRRLDQLRYEEALDELFRIHYSTELTLRPYSDMGAMVLKYIVESVTGEPLYLTIKKEIMSKIDQSKFFTNIPESLAQKIVNNNFERKIISDSYKCDTHTHLGCVHDPKARLLEPNRQNTSGHAGMFATAKGMVELSAEILATRIISKTALENIGTTRIGYLSCEGKYSQHLGLLCHTKHPVSADSEVYPLLSEKAFAIGGYTGNHYMIDYANNIFSFFASNRCHNRVTTIVKSESVHYDENQVKWNDGKSYINSTRFAWERDEVIHKAQDFSIQLAFIETLFDKCSNHCGTKIRKL